MRRFLGEKVEVILLYTGMVTRVEYFRFQDVKFAMKILMEKNL
jgi:hypothetical protein